MSDRYIPDNEPRDILLSLEELAVKKMPHAPTFRKAAAEITRLREENARLRGEVERLTRERDYWARARNEWEKSARLLEQENKRLTRERDAAIREAVRYQQERDAVPAQRL